MTRRGVARPLVSVIVPAYNYAQFLPDTIDSVRGQALEDWECIVVDDGSTDETPSVLERLVAEDPRVKMVRQDNAGPSAARNLGLSSAQGRYVQLLDADDLLDPAKLESQASVLDGSAGIDIVYGPTVYFRNGDENGETRLAMRGAGSAEPPRLRGTGRQVLDVLLRRNVMTVVAPLVRATVFEDVGTFDVGLRRLEDWQFWVRCALADKCFEFRSGKQPVARIRVHGVSLSYDELPMRLTELEMRRDLRARLRDPADHQLNEDAIDEVSANAGIETALNGHWLDGLRLLLPTALRSRRRDWLLWSAALALPPVPPVTRHLASRRKRRRAT